MTKMERKEMVVKIAKKLEKGHMMGRIYLSNEGLEKVFKMKSIAFDKAYS